MPIKFTTRGYIELYRGSEFVSRHVVETEAVERAISDSEATGEILYTLKYPDKEVDLSRLTRVIRDVDVTRPTTPANLSATPVSETLIDLTWDAATDPQGAQNEANTGVVGYKLYRDGVEIADQAGTSFSDTGRTAYTTYSYQVSAYDAAGNESVKSAAVQGQTLDTTAPTAPVITASQVSSSAISVALTTASTDSGSGVSTYQLEYKRSVDLTWTVHSSVLTAGAFPVQIGSLTASTTYDTRCRATDVSGNTGSYSATSQAATSSQDSSVSDVTTFTVTSGAIEADGNTPLPFTFGHAFKKGDIPTGSYPRIDGITCQQDIRNRWSDGSVKYAVLSGYAPLTQSVASALTVQSGANPNSGSNVAEPTSLDVEVVISGGTAFDGTYTLQSCLGVDRSTWSLGNAGRVRQILGPVMSEFHYYRPTTDSHVAIWFYVRRYSGGETEVETVIENGWLNVTGPGQKDYTVTVSVGGSTVYGPTALNHLHHTRWSRVDWIGTDPLITPKHNAAYFRSTKLVPNYGYTSPSETALNNIVVDAVNQTPFAQGDFPTTMGDAGTSAAILDDHEAYYFTSADARSYRAIVGGTRNAGRYPLYYRDETTGRVPDYRTYPLLSFDWNNTTPSPSGTTPPKYAMSHPASMGYAAYLIEGRWTQLDVLTFAAWKPIATSNYLTRSPSGTAYEGVLACWNAPMTTRGAAWAWCRMAQSAAVLPTELMGASPHASDAALQAAHAQSIADTVAWQREMYIDGTFSADALPGGSGSHVNSIGWLGQYDPYADPTGLGAHWWGGSWMVAYQSIVLGYTSDLGIEGHDSTDIDNLDVVRNHSYDNCIQQLGDDTTWNYRRGGVYKRPYLEDSTDPYEDPAFMTPADSFDEYLSALGLSALSANEGDSLKQHDSDTDMTGITVYWRYALCALSFAVDHGKGTAASKWALVTAASNFDVSALHDAPSFGFVPRTSIPSHLTGLDAYEVRSLTGAYAPSGHEKAADAMPAEWVSASTSEYGNLASVFAAWSSGDGYQRKIMCNGGGHTDGSFNGILEYDFGGTGWTVKSGSLSDLADVPPASDGDLTYHEYSDGNPTSVHSYDGCVVDPTTGGFYRFGGSPWYHGGFTNGVWKFESGAWTRLTNMPISSSGRAAYVGNGKILVKTSGNVGYFYRIATNDFSAAKTMQDPSGGDIVTVANGDYSKVIVIGNSHNRVYTVDNVNETVSQSTFTPTGDTEILAGNALTVLWDPTLECWWIFGGRDQTGINFTTITKMTPDYVCTRFTLTGDTITFSSSDGSWWGMFGRAVLMDEERVIGFAPDYDVPAFVVGLPSA